MELYNKFAANIYIQFVATGILFKTWDIKNKKEDQKDGSKMQLHENIMG